MCSLHAPIPIVPAPLPLTRSCPLGIPELLKSIWRDPTAGVVVSPNPILTATSALTLLSVVTETFVTTIAVPSVAATIEVFNSAPAPLKT